MDIQLLKMVKLKFLMVRAKAFTLIETIITLAICCGILLIGSIQLRKNQTTLIFDNTVKEVTAALDQASRISTITDDTVTVIFSKEKNYLNLSGPNYNKQLDIDKNISIKGLSNFRFSNSGYSKPATVVFSGYGLKREKKYQMLWGRATE